MLETDLSVDNVRHVETRLAEVVVLNRRAANLRAMRKCRGMTTVEMGRRCGVLPNFLVEMENGQRSISIRTIDRVARGLGVASSVVLAELDR